MFICKIVDLGKQRQQSTIILSVLVKNSSHGRSVVSWMMRHKYISTEEWWNLFSRDSF